MSYILRKSVILVVLLISCKFTNAENKLTPENPSLRFSCQNVIGVKTYYWPRTLLTYPVLIDKSISESNLVLVNKLTNKTELFQLSNKVDRGNYLSAELSFMTELPDNGKFDVEFSVSKVATLPANKMQVVLQKNGLEIQGANLKVIVPLSITTPNGSVPAPVISIAGNKGTIGNNVLKTNDKKLISINSETTDNGPLYTEQTIVYKFEGGGVYTAKVMLVNEYPFIILDEDIKGLTKEDGVSLEMEWAGFNPTKRYGTQWDRVSEGQTDLWLDIDKPVYTSYTKEDPHWTGMGWVEDPAKQMIFRLTSFGGNSVREQTPVMSFWETNADKRELGVFVYDANRWNDRQYGIWQPTPDLSVYFRYTNKQLYFNYPLIYGTRSTALSFFPEQEGTKQIAEFNGRLNSIVEKYGSKAAKDMIIPLEVSYRYSQMLMMRYAMLGLNKIKDWQLSYPEKGKHPENIFSGNVKTTPEKYFEQLSTSPMAYYPVGLNFFPGIHSITHRILYSEYVEGYLKNYRELTIDQRKTVEALLMISGYVNTLEEMNSIRRALAGTPNMASDGWSVSAQIAFLFPEHSMAKEWCDFFEKELQINGLFYTRPDVKQYESLGGRWAESLGVYNWANLRPTSFSRSAAELFDGKNRFAYPELINRARWMRDMMTAPITDKGRCYPPHGAHGGGYLVPRYNLYNEVAQSLKYFDPVLSENMFWTADSTNNELENKKAETDWHAVFESLHHGNNTGTNPHLKSCKYTGHGIVLRSGVDTPDELSIHLDQVDKGPNYRWGHQGCGNSGGLYFYAKGEVFTAHENEIVGDHTANDLDGVTNFGVMKGGDYRTIGFNELKAPLYDFGSAQFAELLSDNGKDRYAWPEYLSRSIMLVGTDYFILFDETGTNWRAQNRFSWFNAKGKELPKITFLSEAARKDGWMTAQTPNSYGFYRDAIGSVLSLVTHKKKEVSVLGGKSTPIGLLNSPDVSEFSFNKKTTSPKGVVSIKAPKSSDLIFRNGDTIKYTSKNEIFEGKAAFIRRFEDGKLELSLFKGKQIGADGFKIVLDGNGEKALNFSRFSTGQILGKVKTYATLSLKIEGAQMGAKLYVNGILANEQPTDFYCNVNLPKGQHTIELCKDEPTPMESRIAITEYNKNNVSVFVQSDSPCQSVRMEVSGDGGKTWQSRGFAKNGIFVLNNEKTEKVHIRAVSINGSKTAETAPEYPVYFNKTAPHYPEGLRLKLAENKVKLSWGQILGAQKYKLYRKKVGETNFKLVYEGKNRQFEDNVQGVQKAYELPGTIENSSKDRTGLVIYEYAVTAITGYGESVMSPVENTNPSSWRNWNPDTELKFKRQSAFWMQPYVLPEMEPEKYYPE
jgi:hypothetical protein